MTFDEVERATGKAGLAVLGIAEDDGPVVLLGLSREGWTIFTASPEHADGKLDPLDRWSMRIVGALTERLGARPAFPFGGPPYAPFLRWAAASGRMWSSPLGMSIHDEHGLWMSFRGALRFTSLDGIPEVAAERPCEGCAARPCLNACPVDAFQGSTYDVARCAAHVASREGAACRERGCLARRACWVGQDWVPEPERAAFHMRAFLRARSET